MPRFKSCALGALTAALMGCAQNGAADLSEPSTAHARTVEAAEREGAVVVYSVTSAVPELLEDFQRLYPKVRLDYRSFDTGPLYEQVIKESAAGTTGDVIWSSAMDLQVRLVADGYAATYRSPEAGQIPAWAVWRDQAYGTTFEPVGFVYNRTLVDVADVPRTRADFVMLLSVQAAKYRGKITAFDPANSGLGYMLMTQDQIASSSFWATAKALGDAGVYPATGSGAQFVRLGKGDSLIGYNLLTSYATGRIKKDLPQLAVVLPTDHTLVMSRVMFISRKAAHPNAAKLWVDYVLSRRGQQILSQLDLGALRADVAGEMTPQALGARLGSALKPIPVGPALLTPLEPDSREAFLRVWNTTVVQGRR